MKSIQLFVLFTLSTLFPISPAWYIICHLSVDLLSFIGGGPLFSENTFRVLLQSHIYNSVFLKIVVVYKLSSWCTQIVPFMDTITNVHPVIVSRTPGSFRAWLAAYGNRNLIQKNPQQVYNSHLIYHVQFRDGNRASNNFLKKNAMPSLFLAVPTVERRENVLDYEYCRNMAETTAVTLDSDGVDTSTCNMSNKSNPGEAMVWESFCVVATSVPTSRDCCTTTVREL